MKTIHTLVVGGGQAGLATSYHLSKHNIEHAVLEKASRAGYAWSERWDSFALLTRGIWGQQPGWVPAAQRNRCLLRTVR
jgi:putative flavoprotein involved in K+ transport